MGWLQPPHLSAVALLRHYEKEEEKKEKKDPIKK